MQSDCIPNSTSALLGSTRGAFTRIGNSSFTLKPVALALAGFMALQAQTSQAYTFLTVDEDNQIESLTAPGILVGLMRTGEPAADERQELILREGSVISATTPPNWGNKYVVGFWSDRDTHHLQSPAAIAGKTFTNEGDITGTLYMVRGTSYDASESLSYAVASLTGNTVVNEATGVIHSGVTLADQTFDALAYGDSGTPEHLMGDMQGNSLVNRGTISGAVYVARKNYIGLNQNGKVDDRNALSSSLSNNVFTNEVGATLTVPQFGSLIAAYGYSAKKGETASNGEVTYGDVFSGNGIDNAGTIDASATADQYGQDGVFAAKTYVQHGASQSSYYSAAPALSGNYVRNRAGGVITASVVAAVSHDELFATATSGGTTISDNYLLNEGAISVKSLVTGVTVYTEAEYQGVSISGTRLTNAQGATVSRITTSGDPDYFNGASAVYLHHGNDTTGDGFTVEDTQARNAGAIEGYIHGVLADANVRTVTDVAGDAISQTLVVNAGTVSSGTMGVYFNHPEHSGATSVEATTAVNTGTTAVLTGVGFSNENGGTTLAISDTTVVNRGEATEVTGVRMRTSNDITATTVVNEGTATKLTGVTHTNYSLNGLGAITGTTVYNVGTAEVASDATVVEAQGGSVTGNRFYNGGQAVVGGTLRVAKTRATGCETAEVSGNEAHLSGGKLHDVVVASVENGSSTFTGATFRDNKLYVTGETDLSESSLTGVLATKTGFDYSDAEAISGNELVFGQARVMEGEPGEEGELPEGMAGEFVTAPFTGGGRSVASVSGFNKITVKAADWGDDNDIKITNLTALAPEAGEDNPNSKVVVDVSSIAFSSLSEVSEGDVTKILEVTNLTGALELTQEDSTYTAGTTVSGTATAAITDEGHVVRYTLATLVETPENDPDPDSGSEPPSSDNPVSRGEPASRPVLALSAQAQTHTVPLAMAATTAALTQAGDLTASAAYGLTHSRIRGTQAYAVAAGEAARISAGSHVSTRIFMLTAGLGNRTAYESGDLSLSLGVEAGYGKFRNAFDAGEADPYVNKRGHLHYAGAVFTSDWTSLTGWHVGATLRGGRSTTKMNGALWDASDASLHGVRVTSNYVGAELELGRVFKLSEGMDLDLYGKYLGLYQSGDAFTVGEADSYEVRSVTSNRLRLGARLAARINPESSWFAGAGVEREFDGRSEVVIANDGATAQADPARLKGTRGLVEAGWRFDPESATGLHYGFTVKGAFGSGYRAARAEARVNYVF